MRKLCNWLDDRTDYRRLFAPIRTRMLARGPSWWLTSGSCLLWLFVIELITGLALMTSYSPSMTAAWASVHYINDSPSGALLRGLHYYTSHALILMFLIHVTRVVLTAAFRAPRELIWITGLLLIPLTIVWAVTGNPLSANQKGMAQIDVEGKIVGSTPYVGSTIQRILIGGSVPGNLTLTHLYFLHVGLLPTVVICLLFIHVSQVYRHGNASLQEQKPASPADAYWPYQTFRNLTVLSCIVSVIMWLAWRYGAPLDAPVDPNLPLTPRPEWYFRWLFELRRHFSGDWEFIATLVVPSVLLLYFLLLPAADKVLDRRGSIFLRIATVIVGFGVWGSLTWISFERDWNDEEYLAAQNLSHEFAARAQVLADRNTIPIEGAVTLLRTDPKTQGPLLFQRHCASCHSYTDESGKGIIAKDPSAPNLYGFGSSEWIRGLLDPLNYKSSRYFGKTKFIDGEMADKLHEMFKESKDVKKLREQLALAANALSAEAQFPTAASSNGNDSKQIAAGRELIRGELGCTDCHHHGDQGDLGSAPDLTGYASRDWLVGIISNPQHKRFYPGDRNDRMPAFARNPQQSQQNILGSQDLELLVAWLRRDWYEDGLSAAKASDLASGRSTQNSR